MLAGVLAGTLVFLAWINDLLLGVAVGGIAAGLIACMLWAVPEWHRFGVGLLLGTVVTAAAWFVAF